MKTHYKGIVIIEIPHQRTACAWIADNWKDAAIRSNSQYTRVDKVREDIAHDLSGCYFFTTSKDLKWFINNYLGHQKHEAIKAAIDCGKQLNWL